MVNFSNIKQPKNATAVIVMADGNVLWGIGVGAETTALGEVCFNTSMTGYQEILTDPSYAGQIITFTFPHIGNVGTNDEDFEAKLPAARGLVLRQDITSPSNWRSTKHLDEWLKYHKLPGICNVDTRALTNLIRDGGAPSAVICHNDEGVFDLEALYREANAWPGLSGMDLAKTVTCEESYQWEEGTWSQDQGSRKRGETPYHVVAIDYGAKHNILRCLVSAGCKVTVVPCTAAANDILSLNPDGIFLSNGPGDPAATGHYAVPVVQELLQSDKPMFGICLGHQILALALGGKTEKMHLGHRGANHPVKDIETGKVEITSQNHGFQVIPDSLPENVAATHVSLFDGSNEGLKLKDKPVFSVQYHPEASPGPQDSHYLFDRFVDLMKVA